MPNDNATRVPTRLYATRWYAMPALALETPALRVITVPEMGAKIVSLFDRRNEREWLLPPKNERFQPASYGASFVEQDMSGWDEMFPTIDRCQYPAQGAYFGATLPDHGEVWSLAWQVDECSPNAICLSVAGRALPYQLARMIHVTGERSLRLSYEVTNVGDEPLVALWTAHPQFAVDETTQIVLPDGVDQVINVQATDELPMAGEAVRWHNDGQGIRLDRIRPTDVHKHRKLYLPPDKPIRWAGLRQGEAGAWLRLSWDTREIPYLGIWVDEGAFNPKPTAALEPSTGYYDTLARAWQNQRVMTLPPGVAVCWSLDVTVGVGDFD